MTTVIKPDRASESAAAADSDRTSRRAGQRLRRRPRRRRDTKLNALIASFALLCLTVVGSVSAIGSVHPPVLLVTAVTSMAAILVALFSRSERYTVPGPVILVLGLVAYTVLQCVPLPMAVLESIAPRNAMLWKTALTLVGEPLEVASISVDPGASWIEAVKWAMYAAVFLTASFAASQLGPRRGAVLLFGSAVVVAWTTVIHGLIDASRVFGVYTPIYGVTRWQLGPLINPNNLSGYVNLGSLAGLGLLISRRPSIPRWLLASTMTSLIAVTIVTGSRAGVLTLLLGIVAYVVLLRRSRRAEKGARAASFRQFVPVFVIMSGGVALLVILAATNQTWRALQQGDVEKLRMLPWSLPMMGDHLWTGVGRGAFHSTFPAYGPGHTIYSHPENFLVQWISEWGVPAGAVAVAGFAFFLGPGVLGRAPSSTQVGLFCGVLGIVVQNLADLSLEVPGIAVSVAAALGTLWGSQGARASHWGVVVRKRWLLAAALVAACVVPATMVVRGGMRTLLGDRESMEASLRQADLTSEFERRALIGELNGAIVRYPAEAYFFRARSLVAWRAAENPMPWITETLIRSPRSARSHYLLAAYLGTQGALNQALLELRIAAEYEPDISSDAARLATKLTRNFQELLRSVPDGTGGVRMLMALGRELAGDSVLSLRCYEEAVARDPSNVKARLRIVSALNSAILSDAPDGACAAEARQVCEERALAHLDVLDKEPATSSEAAELRARLMFAMGRVEDALSLFARACEVGERKLHCYQQWLKSAVAARDVVNARAAAKGVERHACSSETQCAATYANLGKAMRDAGDAKLAVTYFQRAVKEEPTASRWAALGAAAREAGEHAVSAAALANAATLRRGDSTLGEEAATQRQRVTRDLLLAPKSEAAGAETRRKK